MILKPVSEMMVPGIAASAHANTLLTVTAFGSCYPKDLVSFVHADATGL
jgi:hypothetical protein